MSEAPPEAVRESISEKEFHTYSCFLNTSDAISEDEMVLNILDVLTGTPSSIFFYDIVSTFILFALHMLLYVMPMYTYLKSI